VKKLDIPFAAQSISFCTDGFTLAIGAHNKGAIALYDLRSPDQYQILDGHAHTVNSVMFKNKEEGGKAARRSSTTKTP